MEEIFDEEKTESKPPQDAAELVYQSAPGDRVFVYRQRGERRKSKELEPPPFIWLDTGHDKGGSVLVGSSVRGVFGRIRFNHHGVTQRKAFLAAAIAVRYLENPGYYRRIVKRILMERHGKPPEILLTLDADETRFLREILSKNRDKFRRSEKAENLRAELSE